VRGMLQVCEPGGVGEALWHCQDVCVTILLWEGVGMQQCCVPHQRLIRAICCGVFVTLGPEGLFPGWHMGFLGDTSCCASALVHWRLSVSCPLGWAPCCMPVPPASRLGGSSPSDTALLLQAMRMAITCFFHGLHCVALLAAHAVRGGALVLQALCRGTAAWLWRPPGGLVVVL
jgi:hypothetical protein